MLIRHTPRTFFPAPYRGIEPGHRRAAVVLQIRSLPCYPVHLQGKCLDQDLNLDLDLRRVPCDPLHHRDISTSARSRTPCDGFGDRLLSQEHARVSAPGLSTGGNSVLITLRVMLLPHAEREEYELRNNYSRSVTFQYASLMNFDQLSIRTLWSADQRCASVPGGFPTTASRRCPGRTGLRRRCIRACSGVRSAFRLLQAMHASTQFSQLDTPPCERGRT